MLLAHLRLYETSCKQLEKHSKQAKIVLDKLDIFINKDENAQLSQYSISRQKEIAGLFKKSVFKVVISKKILSNA